ncbi:MAG: hypothetical protein M1546_19615 [Chloroflexi bacterium]|nr:hypothetical protein [Chloroflexota bacterium]
MRASLERTGGFAGMRLTSTADTDKLAPEEAKELRQLVEAADFFRLPPTIASQANQPDRFQYKLTVEDDQRTHTVMVGEAAIPPRVRPLAEWLTQYARRR